MAGESCAEPVLLMTVLALGEAAFLACALLTMENRRPHWLPLRVVHYCLAVVICLQFGGAPITETMGTVSPSFLLYIIVGFNKFFELGFIMTKARLTCGSSSHVQPLLSSCWPCMLILGAIVAPSTNWVMAGNVTYPYFPHVIDRCLYVAGGLVVAFLVDRSGQYGASRQYRQCCLVVVFGPSRFYDNFGLYGLAI
eukprot:gnl/MRDRNA2_/MRDRNA2_22214_c0_seq2.p1 gnl/MRDRNA2_/MRDRNA2_22214_c0~~gnl/MRDRNA2_/MRDRNA2_22214_c0_seq2.p1  ORF type:complete len:223 (+),score=12.20 gnl/MRDRNA2_/MRDRNA2_22214_c0_seq2:82-669(+)